MLVCMEDAAVQYVRRVLKMTGWSATELAKRAGVSSTTITRPLNDPEWPHTLSGRTLQKVAVASAIAPDDKALAAATSLNEDSEFVSIPRYNVEISGGPGSLVDAENLEDHIPFTRAFLQRRLGRTNVKDLIMLEVRGDSMEPLISDGDLVMIDMADRHAGGSVMAVRARDEALIKRIERLPTGFRVASENPRYESYVVPVEDAAAGHFEIIGRVRWIGRVL